MQPTKTKTWNNESSENFCNQKLKISATEPMTDGFPTESYSAFKRELTLTLLKTSNICIEGEKKATSEPVQETRNYPDSKAKY